MLTSAVGLSAMTKFGASAETMTRLHQTKITRTLVFSPIIGCFVALLDDVYPRSSAHYKCPKVGDDNLRSLKVDDLYIVHRGR